MNQELLEALYDKVFFLVYPHPKMKIHSFALHLLFLHAHTFNGYKI